MGAPKGNMNAFKHGIYGDKTSREEQSRLRKMPPEDLRHEMYMMRVVVNNAFEIHQKMHAKVKSELPNPQTCDVESLAKITNSLCLAVTTLNSTARTYALFHGKDKTANDAYDEALNSLPVFLDEDYLCETHQRTERQKEIRTE